MEIFPQESIFLFSDQSSKKNFLTFVGRGQGAGGESWHTRFCGEFLGYSPCLESL